MKLRDLSPAVRFGLTCLLLVMLGGMIASAAHMYLHHSVRDEKEGLSIDDLRGAYHGVRTVAPMITALEREHPWDYEVDEAERLRPAEREALLEWLNGDRLSDDYDNLDLGDAAPAEIIARSCLNCHTRQAGGEHACPEIPLEYFDDVMAVSISREINPTSMEILTISTHTHALSLATLTIIVIALSLYTRLPRFLVSAAALLMGAGLLADLGAQWLARWYVEFVWVLLVGGMIYGGVTSLTIGVILLDLWWPKRG
ncbi:MAG: hypothetical protein SYC29_16355 [Planctomycetota bacterium]|nr:hypothetical protein [Planctomycetota bacterium]